MRRFPTALRHDPLETALEVRSSGAKRQGALMLDPEIERLRRLRGAALKLRALAKELGPRGGALDDMLLHRGACAAWRVARIVSGRLRAHPFVDFQKDAGAGLLLRNAIAAKLTAQVASTRLQALNAFGRQLKLVSRQLDDARALAWDRDLSDTLGRSQSELRAVAAATDAAVSCASQDRALPSVRQIDAAPLGTLAGIPRGERAAADWPFVAL
jgi:hypothetical protein